MPVVSSSPKLGTAGGALGAYLHKFDPDSRVSIFGVQAIYTSTDSLVASAFARTSFGADHHRVVLIGVGGRIRNDYDDYLGTGEPLQTRDEITAVALRYQYRVFGKWWLGAQGSAANYQVLGESAEDDLAPGDARRARVRVRGRGGRRHARLTRQPGHAHPRHLRERQQRPLQRGARAAPTRSTRTAWTCVPSGRTAPATCWRCGSTTG